MHIRTLLGGPIIFFIQYPFINWANYPAYQYSDNQFNSLLPFYKFQVSHASFHGKQYEQETQELSLMPRSFFFVWLFLWLGVNVQTHNHYLLKTSIFQYFCGIATHKFP